MNATTIEIPPVANAASHRQSVTMYAEAQACAVPEREPESSGAELSAPVPPSGEATPDEHFDRLGQWADANDSGAGVAVAVEPEAPSPDAESLPVQDCEPTEPDAHAPPGQPASAFMNASRTDELPRVSAYEPLAVACTGDNVAAAMADDRPKLRLPGDDSLLSDFSAALGGQLRDKGIYYRNGEVVALDDGALRPLDGQRLRTTAEKYVVCYRQRRIGEQTYIAFSTMRIDDANGVIVAPQFTGQLLKLRRVNHARLPTMRADGRVELLPVGYDLETQTLTLPGVEYQTDFALADAVAIINDLLSEFCFADGGRSKAVVLAAMLGLYAGQFLPEKSLRPCFIFAANAEGAGKTLLVTTIVTPTLGELPTGCKAEADDEVRKVILTAVREGRAVVFLDNLKGRLNSPALEAFCSAPVWTDRKLGVNESITADNIATVFITGNGLTVSPDMRRRSLFVELHLEVERAEDRQFRRPLDLPALLTMRPKILAALWAMVNHWNTQGRPTPSRSHSAFPSWANIVAGIVETAGFACPLEMANVTSADQDGDDMRQLVEAMAVKGEPIQFAGLVTLARELGCFENIIGSEATDDLKHADRMKMARLLTRYDRRLVGTHRFIVIGKGHGRKFRVEVVHRDAHSHTLHTVSPDMGKGIGVKSRGHSDRVGAGAEGRQTPCRASQFLGSSDGSQ
ncbi:MAG: hypothetical protein ACYDH9_15720 [Limisphaerales bacterium]